MLCSMSVLMIGREGFSCLTIGATLSRMLGGEVLEKTLAEND